MKTKAPDQILLEKIKMKSAAVAIIGMGFIGTTLGQLIAKKGFHVFGIFRKKAKAIAFEKKKIPRFHTTCDSSELTKADIVIITVPTLVDKKNRPDLEPLRQAAALLKRHIKAGRLVILESTVSPGMTRDIFDFEQNFIGYSPDRIDPGNATYTIENTPKIVSGKNRTSLMLTKAFYEKIVTTVVPVSSLEIAEMSKMLENIVRYVLINLMNEMEDYAVKKNINLWEVIDAAATKPFGYFPVYPGAGIGGHCIPVNFHYLLDDAKRHGVECSILKETARFHEQRIKKIVDQAFDMLPIKHPRIFILGVAIKPGSDNIVQSVGLKMLKIIEAKGGIGAYHDPFVPKIEKWRSLPMTKKVLEKQDLFLIVTSHKEIDFSKLLFYKKPIIDTKNIFKLKNGITRI